MKHKLLQTWARKSAKLLAAFALLATTAGVAMAETATFTVANLAPNTSYTKTTYKDAASGIELTAYVTKTTSPKDYIGLSKNAVNSKGNGGNWIAVSANDNEYNIVSVTLNNVYTTSSKGANLTVKVNSSAYTGLTDKIIKNPAGTEKYNEHLEQATEGTEKNYSINDKAFIIYNNEGNGQVLLNGITITYEKTPVSTELGEIMYGSEAADNKELSGFKGDVFTFSADNAENMTITVDPANTGVVSRFENGSISWTAPAVEEETPVMLTVKATKGAAEKEATVMVTINKAPLCTMPPVFTPGVGTITKGSTVTITCENAKQIKYWISENADDTETDAQTVDVPATVTIDQNCWLHACGINADGIAGETSAVQYTVTEPTFAEFDFTNAESINAAEGSEGISAENNTSDSSTNNLNGKSLKKNGITLSFSVGTNSNGNKPRWWKKTTNQGGGTELRIYTDNTLTVSAENGKKLSKITMDGTVAMTASAGTISNGVWTPSASVQTIARAEGDITSVVLTPTSTCNISSIAVEYAPSTPTGIADIEAEDGEAVYFNLQGVRVQNPEKGIFIRVQNGKASKIMK